jgi:2-dehydropantoate 2-reductase
VKVVVLGAGALGSIVGGAFADAGADVTLIGRRAHVDAIRAVGLRIESLQGSRTMRGLRAEESIAGTGSADLLVLCTKSYDTAAALGTAAHLRGRLGAALSLQNGGRKDEELAQAFGQEAVVGAVSLVGGALVAPGVVRHTNDGGNWIGELDGRRTARVEAIEGLFRKGGLAAEIVADIRSATWCKLNQMVPAAVLSCLTRLPIHQIYLDDRLARVFVELSREMAAIAPHLGVELEDFPGFAVKRVCILPFDTAVDSVKARGRGMRDKGMTGVKISMLQDLERGRRTEAEQVVGHVIRLAAQHRVPVPKLDLLYRILRGMEAAGSNGGQ